MSVTTQIILAIVTSALASSGLWAFIMKKSDKKDATTRMLIGLGHDRIMSLGKTYIERGEITTEEYENLHTYLFEPYTDLGGNGSAAHIMQEVNKLPIRK